MSDTVIKVEGVSKKYCRTIKHTMLYGASDLAKSFLGLDQKTERLRDGEFWAVDNVSFELRRGETLGIIGPNGSGKSTILKMLNGIFMPDKGRIEINGRVGALIEVGAGFHPMLTGRENIYVNGAILGMTKKEIDRKFDEIVSFADIETFIDSPVKHYSSGMHVRLGFAIAVHCEPEILLVDEVLAVGDIDFQRKSYRRMRKLLTGGTSVILVSHNMRTLQDFCQRALMLNHGRSVAAGKSAEVAKAYIDYSNEPIKRDTAGACKTEPPEDGNIRVSSVVCLDSEGNPTYTHPMDQPLRIRIHYKLRRPVKAADFQVTVYSMDNIVISCCNSKLNGCAPFELTEDGAVDLVIDEQLMPGKYRLAGAVLDRHLGEPLDVWGTTDNRYVEFSVKTMLSSNMEAAFWGNLGLINMRQKWSISPMK